MANKIDAHIQKDDGREIERILHSDFRKGLTGLEEEQRKEFLAKLVTKVDEQYVQGDTDWDVNAVVDEDEL